MDSMSRPKKSLIDGRLMRCPRCKNSHDILQYIRLEVIEEFASETTPCYKCPKCKWIFAPADQMPHDLILRMESMISELTSKLEQSDGSKVAHD